ncbi:MAG TPA: BadF/BadG/BcrA/BcrD ATPase family protein, partial [Acidothermaceae bacterium]
QHAADMGARLTAATRIDVVVVDDTEAALAGAFGAGPGVIVVAGTGSNALGQSGDGRTARAGGYGFLVGDEGSAYWFASQAMRAALHSHDGSGPKSPALEAAVIAEYGLDFDAIVRLIYRDPADRQLLTRLAPTVMALPDDPVMTAILDAGCDYLIALANVLRAQLGSGQLGSGQLSSGQLSSQKRGDELPVAMHGGVFSNPYVRSRFVSTTGAQTATRAPEFGAVDLAMRHHRRSDHGTARSI